LPAGLSICDSASVTHCMTAAAIEPKYNVRLGCCWLGAIAKKTRYFMDDTAKDPQKISPRNRTAEKFQAAKVARPRSNRGLRYIPFEFQEEIRKCSMAEWFSDLCGLLKKLQQP
jgi:hypothetical protein